MSSNANAIPFPAEIKMSANLSTEWKRFKSQWTNYEVAADLSVESVSKQKRAAIFLACIGTEAYELFQTFDMTDADKQDIERVIAAFEKHFVGETNVTYERYVFNRRVQEAGEKFDSFLADLRRLVRTCDYENLEDSIIRDRIVMGIRDDATRRKLLQTRKLDLALAVDICKASELAVQQLKAMTNGDEVHALKTSRQPRPPSKQASTTRRSDGSHVERLRDSSNGAHNQRCQRCG